MKNRQLILYRLYNEIPHYSKEQRPALYNISVIGPAFFWTIQRQKDRHLLHTKTDID